MVLATLAAGIAVERPKLPCGIDNDKGDAIEDTGMNKDGKEQMKSCKLQESEGDIRLFPLASPPVQLVQNMKNKYKIQNTK